MTLESKIEQTYEFSRSVLANCCLDNGAVIAANTDLDIYPKEARDYRYVWLRDAAVIIYAAQEARVPMAHDKRQNLVKWMFDRLEGFSESGNIIKRYSTNGRHEYSTGHEYQPDQAPTLIWALDQTTGESDKLVDQTIALLATGLAKSWRRNHFVHPESPKHKFIQDLWENANIPSREGSVHTFTLAAAAKGLLTAINRLESHPESDIWIEALQQMRHWLNYAEEYPYAPWKLPRTQSDRQIDASLTGLVWPFDVIPNPEFLNNTLNRINQRLYAPGLGISRYEGDSYDGMNYNPVPDSPKSPANRWPLLGFWHAISLQRLSRFEEANSLFLDQMESIPSVYIPEQIPDDTGASTSPMPLGRAHAKFILCSNMLGYQPL